MVEIAERMKNELSGDSPLGTSLLISNLDLRNKQTRRAVRKTKRIESSYPVKKSLGQVSILLVQGSIPKVCEVSEIQQSTYTWRGSGCPGLFCGFSSRAAVWEWKLELVSRGS
jgi:hypothetical protein